MQKNYKMFPITTVLHNFNIHTIMNMLKTMLPHFYEESKAINHVKKQNKQNIPIHQISSQEISTFFTGNFGQKTPHMVPPPPMSNLTKVSFWTS